MSYDNTNSGVLFKQTEKKSEKAPDYKGKLNVDGRDLELAGWIREGKSGKFLSLKVQEPFKKGESKPKAAPVYAGNDDPNDSIPFAWAVIPIAGLIAGATYAQGVLQVWA